MPSFVGEARVGAGIRGERALRPARAVEVAFGRKEASAAFPAWHGNGVRVQVRLSRLVHGGVSQPASRLRLAAVSSKGVGDRVLSFCWVSSNVLKRHMRNFRGVDIQCFANIGRMAFSGAHKIGQHSIVDAMLFSWWPQGAGRKAEAMS